MGDFCSYVGQAIDLFRYDPRSPMLFSSGLFLFVFLGFSLIYGLLKRRLTLRIVYVTLFSLYFYYKTSGLFFLLLVGLSLSDFAIGRLMHRSRRSCRSFRSSWRVRSSGPGTFCRRFTGIPFSFRATCSDAESF